LDSGACDGIIPVAIAADVINLLHTKTQRYGSQIGELYKGELANLIHNTGLVGLGSYNTEVQALTDTPSVSPSDYNYYYGGQIESNPDRQYKATTSSTTFASTVVVNAALLAARTGFFHYDQDGVWTSLSFHPDPNVFTFPSFDWGNCYRVPFNGDCTPIAKNAAAIILAYHPDMDNLYAAVSEDYTRTKGPLFGIPVYGNVMMNAQTDEYIDYYMRTTQQINTDPQFLNALFYQYDGMQSLAIRHSTDLVYLPPQLFDTLPMNVGWSNKYFDGVCFNERYVDPVCTRSDTFQEFAPYNTRMCNQQVILDW
jgi:hypothetical protein